MGNFIVLMLLGAVIYWVFKSIKRSAMRRPVSMTKEQLEQSDLGLFIALVAKVAKADGRVDELEAQLVGLLFDDICRSFDDSQSTREVLKSIFNRQRDTLDNTVQIAQELARKTQRHRVKREHFIGFLIQLAFIDGKVSKEENAILTQIAEALDIDPKLYHAMYDQFEKIVKNIQPQASIEDAYKTLGVEKTDDLTTIKKAYRKLVREYHPDIVKAQNRDENYMKQATLKTQEINHAYEMIKKHKAQA